MAECVELKVAEALRRTNSREDGPANEKYTLEDHSGEKLGRLAPASGARGAWAGVLLGGALQMAGVLFHNGAWGSFNAPVAPPKRKTTKKTYVMLRVAPILARYLPSRADSCRVVCLKKLRSAESNATHWHY